ncbi:MAG: hypothetical protein AAGJ18_28970 [Bacteroidota bacterium]
MSIPPTKHEIDYIKKFEQKGYTASYKSKDGKIQNLENKKWYAPEDLKLVQEFRYEGMSNPSDNSILYIIEANDGTKGTALVAYGPTADSAFAELFLAVPNENQEKLK